MRLVSLRFCRFHIVGVSHIGWTLVSSVTCSWHKVVCRAVPRAGFAAKALILQDASICVRLESGGRSVSERDQTVPSPYLQPDAPLL